MVSLDVALLFIDCNLGSYGSIVNELQENHGGLTLEYVTKTLSPIGCCVGVGN